jgi:hypothetical protein
MPPTHLRNNSRWNEGVRMKPFYTIEQVIADLATAQATEA